MPSSLKMAKGAAITAVAKYLPETVLDNAEVEEKVETSDTWIQQRTGIRERRVAVDRATSDLAVASAEVVLQRRGVRPQELDAVICATCTPDYPMPATASVISHKLGISSSLAFDVNAACSGFIVALACARGLVESGVSQRILLIGAEKMSSVVNDRDRNTYVLFGDGAGSVLVERVDDPPLFSFAFGGLSEHWDAIWIPAGGSKLGASEETVRERLHTIKMRGRDVFRLAVDTLPKVIAEVLEKNALDLASVDWLVPHQANFRLLKAVCERLHFPLERCIVNVERYGNTSAASVPIALAEAEEEGKLQEGQKILLCGFGAGLSFSVSLLEWKKWLLS